MPRFRVEVEEIKKAELEGIVGLLAKLLGKYFDDMVTQIAEGRAALLNKKLNAEVLKRATVFKEYGVFCGIDYGPEQVVLHFDLTRLKSEGIVGYVFSTLSARNGAPLPLGQPQTRLSRVHHVSRRTRPAGPRQRGRCLSRPDTPAPGVAPLQGWHGRRDHLYTASAEAASLVANGLQDERRRLLRLLQPRTRLGSLLPVLRSPARASLLHDSPARGVREVGLQPLTDPAAPSMLWRAALGAFVASTSMRQFISLSCSWEHDRLKRALPFCVFFPARRSNETDRNQSQVPTLESATKRVVRPLSLPDMRQFRSARCRFYTHSGCGALG